MPTSPHKAAKRKHPPETADHSADPAAPEAGPKASPETPPAPPARAAWAQRLAFVQEDRIAWLVSAAIFVLLLIAAFVVRTRRMDLPPIDYPASRQLWNGYIARALAGGKSLFSMHSGWLELQFQAWITARTAFLCKLFGCELWTLGRFWSIFFSTAAVALSPLAVWLASSPEAPLRRRLRLALILMALLAFNTYLKFVSRILMNEPISLYLQMQTLVLFLAFRRSEERRAYLLLGLFVVSLILTGWAKIPGLVWGPAYALYLLCDTRLKPALRWGALAAVVAGGCLVLALYGLNPFTMLSQYKTANPQLAEQFAAWRGNPIWIRTFLGKSLLMTGVPAALFLIPGLVRAPLIFVVAFVGALAMGFLAVNLNLYNSCHLIIPASAVAAWGIDWLLEATPSLGEGLPPRSLRGRLSRIGSVALIALIFIFGSRLTPQYEHRDDYRADALLGWQVIQKEVPAGTEVRNDGIEDNPILLGLNDPTPYPALDLGTGYYMSFQRFDSRLFGDAMNAWVRWSSLPDESGVILYSKEADTLAKQADVADFTAFSFPPMQLPSAFHLKGLHVAREHLDTAQARITARAGETLKLGLDWGGEGARLALMTWQSARLGQLLPPPIRQGGIAFRSYAAICLPAVEGGGTPVYTFEIPRTFPPGDYRVIYWGIAQPADANSEQAAGMMPIPLTLHIEPAADALAAADKPLSVDFAEAYPQYFGRAPSLWSAGWFFKHIRLEGTIVAVAARPRIYYVATPGRKAGKYRLTIRGSSSPLTSSTSAALQWVPVEVAAIGAASENLGSVPLASTETGSFSIDVQARAPFDTLALTIPIRYAPNGHIPTLLTEFIPEDYALDVNQQVGYLRGVELTPL